MLIKRFKEATYFFKFIKPKLIRLRFLLVTTFSISLICYVENLIAESPVKDLHEQSINSKALYTNPTTPFDENDEAAAEKEKQEKQRQEKQRREYLDQAKRAIAKDRERAKLRKNQVGMFDPDLGINMMRNY